HRPGCSSWSPSLQSPRSSESGSGAGPVSGASGPGSPAAVPRCSVSGTSIGRVGSSDCSATATAVAPDDPDVSEADPPGADSGAVGPAPAGTAVVRCGFAVCTRTAAPHAVQNTAVG